jgi:5-methylcytosine-specific restriction endonuclease McrA
MWLCYQDYLKSRTWKTKSRAAKKRAKRRCQVCNGGFLLEVHHRAYPKKWGTEPLSDLVVLCDRCHEIFHLNYRIPRKPE